MEALRAEVRCFDQFVTDQPIFSRNLCPSMHPVWAANCIEISVSVAGVTAVFKVSSYSRKCEDWRVQVYQAAAMQASTS